MLLNVVHDRELILCDFARSLLAEASAEQTFYDFSANYKGEEFKFDQ